MDPITSRDNKWVKLFRSALRETGARSKDPIAVEGPKLIADALRAGMKAEALLVTEPGEMKIREILGKAGIPKSRVFRITEKLFTGISATEAPQGVAALFQQPQWSFDDILHGRPELDGRLPPSVPLVVVLAGIQDPGNVGTILRSAEAFGATGVVTTGGTADPWSPKALRASAGSALRLPVLRNISLPVVLAQLRMAKIAVVAASARSKRARPPAPGLTTNYNEAMAILIGGEGAGLPADIERGADAVVSIPMADAVESLNAGVAASLILYEIARRGRSRAEAINLDGVISSR